MKPKYSEKQKVNGVSFLKFKTGFYTASLTFNVEKCKKAVNN